MQRVMACGLSDLAVGYFSQDRNKAYRAYDQPLMDAYAALCTASCWHGVPGTLP